MIKFFIKTLRQLLIFILQMIYYEHKLIFGFNKIKYGSGFHKIEIDWWLKVIQDFELIFSWISTFLINYCIHILPE